MACCITGLCWLQGISSPGFRAWLNIWFAQWTVCPADVNGHSNGVVSNGVVSSGAHASNGTASREQIASAWLNPQLYQLLQQVASGAVRPDAAALQLRELSSGSQQVRQSALDHSTACLRLCCSPCLAKQVGDFANTDTWREARTGEPAVVWGAGKTPDELAAIMQRMAAQGQLALATRIEPHVAAAVQHMLPEVRPWHAGHFCAFEHHS